MALIIPSHRRSRAALLEAGIKLNMRKLHVAVEAELDADTLATLIKQVPQCVVDAGTAKVTKVEEEVVDLSAMTKKELAAIATEKGIEVGLTMKKSAIIDAIATAEVTIGDE